MPREGISRYDRPAAGGRDRVGPTYGIGRAGSRIHRVEGGRGSGQFSRSSVLIRNYGSRRNQAEMPIGMRDSGRAMWRGGVEGFAYGERGRCRAELMGEKVAPGRSLGRVHGSAAWGERGLGVGWAHHPTIVQHGGVNQSVAAGSITEKGRGRDVVDGRTGKESGEMLRRAELGGTVWLGEGGVCGVAGVAWQWKPIDENRRRLAGSSRVADGPFRLDREGDDRLLRQGENRRSLIASGLGPFMPRGGSRGEEERSTVPMQLLWQASGLKGLSFHRFSYQTGRFTVKTGFLCLFLRRLNLIGPSVRWSLHWWSSLLWHDQR